MGNDPVPSRPGAPSILAVAPETGDRAALTAAVRAAGPALHPTHALSLPAALAALATGAFDGVVAHVGAPDVAAVEVAHALVRRAGGAAVVVVVDDGPHVPDGLQSVADLVLHTDDLTRDWLPRLRRMIDHAGVAAALRAAEASVTRLSGIVDSVTAAVFTVSFDGVVTSWNAGAERLYGYRAADIVGTHVGVLHAPGSDEPRRLIATVRAGEPVRGLETVRRTRDGRLTEVSIDLSPLTDSRGAVEGVVVVAHDISDRRELEAELARVTMHDALTDLPNRAYLMYRLAQDLEVARAARRPVAALLVDLDQFKAVNDVHGHLVGDRVLQRVADRLRLLGRPADVVARLGGDEFVLACPDLDERGASRLAHEVIEAVAEPIAVESRVVRIGASVGVAIAPPVDPDAELLLKHADAAMGEAKSRGRSRSQLFDPEVARRAADERRLAEDLRDALHRDRLEVLYQPVVGLDGDRTVGFEALARWHHPAHGAVPPGTFVPLAEAHGFVTLLDRWVMDRACHDTMAAVRAGRLPRTIRVAVNLSARTLDDPGLVRIVDDALRRSGLPPHCLAIEVTETAILLNRDAARASLEDLHSLGVATYLDDFGTGYSSLSFLRELPVTGVKIDRSFVRDAAECPEDLAITEAIVRLARGLGLETVAEGVETVEQLDLLRRLGCAHGQGFWWAAALPLDTLADTFFGVRGRAGARRVREPLPSYDAAAHWGPHPRRQLLDRITREQQRPEQHRPECCLRGGLESGQGWLVVADAERRTALARELGHLHAAAVARGQLVELDAYETVRRVAGPDGRPDETRFEHLVGGALHRLRATCPEVGLHVQLGPLTQPLLDLRASTELRRLHVAADLGTRYGDHPVDCARHGRLPGAPVAVEGCSAS